jgi:hypothetical protein
MTLKKDGTESGSCSAETIWLANISINATTHVLFLFDDASYELF